METKKNFWTEEVQCICWSEQKVEQLSWNAFEIGEMVGRVAVMHANFLTDISDPTGRTYFVGGSGYKAGVPEEGFTDNLIEKATQILGDSFYIVKGSPMGGPRAIQAAYSGRWAILHASTVLKADKYPNIRRTVDEIVNDYITHKGVKDGVQDEAISLNLIGTSYGSAVVAQAAVNMLEENNGIEHIRVLYLRASMVSDESPLGQRLKELQRKGAIGYLVFDNNEEDSIVGAGGNSKKEGRRNFRKKVLFGSPSVVNRNKHPHNVDAKDIGEKESDEVIQKFFIDSKAAGDIGVEKAKKMLNAKKLSAEELKRILDINRFRKY